MNMNTKQKERRYSTSNFYPACFLFARGMHLIAIDRTNPQRSEFVFEDSPKREKLLQDFSFASDDDPAVLVDARRMVTAIKTLKEKLYQ